MSKKSKELTNEIISNKIHLLSNSILESIIEGVESDVTLEKAIKSMIDEESIINFKKVDDYFDKNVGLSELAGFVNNNWKNYFTQSISRSISLSYFKGKKIDYDLKLSKEEEEFEIVFSYARRRGIGKSLLNHFDIESINEGVLKRLDDYFLCERQKCIEDPSLTLCLRADDIRKLRKKVELLKEEYTKRSKEYIDPYVEEAKKDFKQKLEEKFSNLNSLDENTVKYHGESSWSGICNDASLFNWALIVENSEEGISLKGHNIIRYTLKYHIDDMPLEIRDKIIDTILANKELHNINREESYLQLILGSKTLFIDKDKKKVFEKEAEEQQNGPYDMRYWILRNPNWSLTEKQNLIGRFWNEIGSFKEFIEEIERDLYRNIISYGTYTSDNFELDKMYKYSLEDLTELYQDKNLANSIMTELDFIRRLRLMQSKPNIMNRSNLHEYFDNIKQTIKETGFELIPLYDNEQTKANEFDHEKQELAKQYYQSHYDINELRVFAEEIGPCFARFYFEKIIAKKVLHNLGKDSEKKCHTIDGVLGPIWFFAKSIGLVNKSLLEYTKTPSHWMNEIGTHENMACYFGEMTDSLSDMLDAMDEFSKGKEEYCNLKKIKCY